MSDSPHAGGPMSLADGIERIEQARFVGRTRELQRLCSLLTQVGPRVVYLHGPPGVGSSCLARAALRELRRSGHHGVYVDVAVAGSDWPKLDEHEIAVIDPLPAGPGGELVRRVLEQSGRPDQRVLVVSRRPPDAGWAVGGWEAVLHRMEIGRLDAATASALVHRLGLPETRTSEVMAWAAGNPAALVAAAEVAVADDHANRPAIAPALDTRLARSLLERLAGQQLDQLDPRVVHVAALVERVDAALLAAVLPGVDGQTSVRALARCSVSDGDPDEPALTEMVARSIAILRGHRDPAGDRELRRLLADHLHQRVTGGEPRWLPPMAGLLRNPNLRRAFASDVRARVRPTPLMRDDAATLRDVAGAAGAGWWAGVERWVRDAPEAITVARDDDGHIAGWCVLITPRTAPPWAWEDPVVGPRLEHARRRYPRGDVVIWRDAFGTTTDLVPDPTSGVVVAIHGAIQRTGHLHAVCTYGSVVDGSPTATLASIHGAEEVAELTSREDGRTVSCHLLHHGFGGFAGGARALIYRDLGFEPPAPDLASVREVVRAALRSYHDPLALASSPLALGGTVEDRAAHVRDIINRAVEGCTADSEPAAGLAAIEHGYLRPGTTHDSAARALHLGRSTYFRHLGAGIDRVAAWVADDLAASERGTLAGPNRD